MKTAYYANKIPCYRTGIKEGKWEVKSFWEIRKEIFSLMKKYNVKTCYYGHLHSNSHKDAIEGVVEGIQFNLISADYLDFKLLI